MSKGFENKDDKPNTINRLSIEKEEVKDVKFTLLTKHPPFSLYAYNYLAKKKEEYVVIKIDYAEFFDSVNFRVILKKVWDNKEGNFSSCFMWNVEYPDGTMCYGDEFLYAIVGEHVFVDFSIKIKDSGTYTLNLDMN